jgi:hypothetical protein
MTEHSITFSIRIDNNLLKSIDRNAATLTNGNRTQYILSWLPDNYQPTTPHHTQQHPNQTEQPQD